MQRRKQIWRIFSHLFMAKHGLIFYFYVLTVHYINLCATIITVNHLWDVLFIQISLHGTISTMKVLLIFPFMALASFHVSSFVPFDSIFIGVWTVVEAIIVVWEAGRVFQDQVAFLACFQVLWELNSYLISGFVFQDSHIADIFLTQLQK